MPILGAVYCSTAVLLFAAHKRDAAPAWSILVALCSIGGTLLLVQGHRQPLWTSPPSLPMLAVFAVMMVSAAGGIVQRGRGAVALPFTAALVAAMYDARLAPLFVIVAAPAALAALV